MNDYRKDFLNENVRRIQHDAQLAFLRRREAPAPLPFEEVVLRLCSVHDDAALERLAELESRPLPSGRHVIVEVNGAIVASQPLAGGRPLADPFRRTEHLLPLLKLRVDLLVRAEAPQRGFSLRGLVSRRI